MDYQQITDGYCSNNYFNFFKSIVQVYRPKEIVDIGIGDGYELSALVSGIKINGFGRIRAYDVFEKWPYFHKADYNSINNEFGSESVEIIYGDFSEIHEWLERDSIDFFIVSLPMDGDMYDFFIAHYFEKLTKKGIALLEGGSEERDNVHWMKRYNRKPIRSSLHNYRVVFDDIDFFTIEPFPSLTIIKRREEYV